MKSNILTIAAIAAAMMATSCDDNWTPALGDDGQLDLSSVSVINDDATKLVKNEQSRADVDMSNYVVEIFKAGETTPSNTWAYGTMPEVVTLAAGDYSINVKSHEVAKAEWERPYFTGKQTFSIAAGKITQVEPVTCKFASIKVTITVADDLKEQLSDDATFTVIANDEGQLVYGKNETRAGFFEAVSGSNTMVVNFKGSIGGNVVEENFPFVDIEAGQHRDIVFKTKGGPTPPQPSGDVEDGGISVDFTYTDRDIDGNVTYEEEVIEGQRPGQEDPKEPENPDKPVEPVDPVDPAEPIRFESTTINLNGVNIASESFGSAIVNIICEKGIANLWVTIDSESLDVTQVGLAKKFDLVYPGELEESLQGLGFKTGDQIKNSTSSEFDITTFIPMLAVRMDGAAMFPGNHNFIIEVFDVEGNSKTQTLTFNTPQ